MKNFSPGGILKLKMKNLPHSLEKDWASSSFSLFIFLVTVTKEVMYADRSYNPSTSLLEGSGWNFEILCFKPQLYKMCVVHVNFVAPVFQGGRVGIKRRHDLITWLTQDVSAIDSTYFAWNNCIICVRRGRFGKLS